MVKKISLLLVSLCVFFSNTGMSICAYANEPSNDAVIELTEEDLEIISYEQMIEEISELHGISCEEAKKMYPDTSKKETRGITYEYVHSYRAIDVTSEYRPQVFFFLHIGYDNGKPVGIERVVDYALNMKNTYSNSIKEKQFVGDLYVELLDAKQLYYRLSGSFYNNGTSVKGATVTIPIGKGATVSFTGTSTTSLYSSYFDYEVLKIV